MTEEEEEGVVYTPRFLPPPPPPLPLPPTTADTQGEAYTPNPTSVSTGRAVRILGGAESAASVSLDPRSTVKERSGRTNDKKNKK